MLHKNKYDMLMGV